MQLLITRPGVIRPQQKARLRKNGIEVIETDNIENVRFIKPEPEISGSDLAICAMRALNQCSYDQDKGAFLNEVLVIMESKKSRSENEMK